MKLYLPRLRRALLFAILLGCTVTIVRAQNISKLEYFVDADPGFGLGTAVPVNAGIDETANFQFNISTLSVGFHNLYMRTYVVPYQVVVDGLTIKKGGWSLASIRTFYKENIVGGSSSLPNVIAGEYFIDEDPGFGGGIGFPITAGTNVANGGFTFEVSNLTVGFHNLFVRFKDANGKWSLAAARNFYKEQISLGSGGLINIVKGEYFIDTDPGFGSATNIPFNAASNLDNLNFTFDITTLPTGFHNLFMRF